MDELATASRALAKQGKMPQGPLETSWVPSRRVPGFSVPETNLNDVESTIVDLVSQASW